MEKAVKVLPQYQFPSGQTVGFGDTYYGSVSANAIKDLVRIAQKYDDKKLEEELRKKEEEPFSCLGGMEECGVFGFSHDFQ